MSEFAPSGLQALDLLLTQARSLAACGLLSPAVERSALREALALLARAGSDKPERDLITARLDDLDEASAPLPPFHYSAVAQQPMLTAPPGFHEADCPSAQEDSSDPET